MNVTCKAVVGVALVFIAGCRDRSPFDAAVPIILNEDTGWCWFQDERALMDDGRLLMSGVSSEGDITITSFDISTKERTVFVLHERLVEDDHAAPAIYVRPDGRYLAVYSKHDGDSLGRWRISERPGDISGWSPEQQIDNGGRTSYSNLYGMDGRIYNFTRTRDWDPNFMISDDHGANWRYGGRLIDGGGSSQRPYPRYAGNGRDEVHFITTEQHPRQYPNSIYHGYVSVGKAFRSDGSVVNEDIFREAAPSPDVFTRIFAGDSQNVAWTSDIRLDREGHPYIAFSVVKDRTERGLGGMDIRYHYARWDGTRWHEREIAFAGSSLYPGEDEYTGLITLHPSTPDVVFISTDADPVSGEPILVGGHRRYEIFQGTTRDRGETWRWRPVTRNSSEDNLRPIVAADGDAWALIWLRGVYRAYTDYNQAAVGLVFHEPPR